MLLVVLLALQPRLRQGMRAIGRALRAGRLHWWQLLGGIFGAWLVATQGLAVPTLGVAVFTIAVVAGQVFGSLGVDAAGLGPAGPLRPSRARVVGALIALGAVAIAVAPRLEGSAGAATAGLGLLVLTAGLGISVQQAINAHVSVASGWPLAATLVNFGVGTAVLAAVYGIGHLAAGWTMAPLPGQAWLYLGGPLGIAFIAMAAWVVPILGVLRFALASICGQLGGGALLDLLYPQPGVVVGWQMLVGVLLTLLAVAVANRR
jgi:bacterial/archaeal transporter family-2 protein